MKEVLITFPTAKLAKEKGFQIETQKAYINNQLFTNFEKSCGEREFYFDANDFYRNWNEKGWFFDKIDGSGCFGCKQDNRWLEAYSAPTQSLLQKWLREVHDININIETLQKGNSIVYSSYLVYIIETLHVKLFEKSFDTYEQALEQELINALKLIKT